MLGKAVWILSSRLWNSSCVYLVEVSMKGSWGLPLLRVARRRRAKWLSILIILFYAIAN